MIVHVIAGDPTAEDEALVRAADAHGTPIVLVQLWPQAEWGRPFVLSPFVVECEAGEGFPVSEIGARILEAAEDETVLAARVPLFEELEKRNIVKGALIRTTPSGWSLLAGRRPGRSSRWSRPACSRGYIRPPAAQRG